MKFKVTSLEGVQDNEAKQFEKIINHCYEKMNDEEKKEIKDLLMMGIFENVVEIDPDK